MVLSMERWIGKVAVVTGASAGIGAVVCEYLVSEGVIVAGIARRKEKTEELAKKLAGKKGKLHAVKADMTKEEDIVEAFKWVTKNLGPVHILINNAGVLKNTSLMDGDAKLWKEVLDTNVIGLSIATREAVRSMRASKVDGHIIHVNSVVGHFVTDMPNFNVYPASKFAVTALAQQLRFEFNAANSKIKITSVSPGPVDTDIAIANKMDKLVEFFERAPILKGSDVAEAIIYALSTGPDCLVQELMLRPVLELSG